jgi:hypothetical protein
MPPPQLVMFLGGMGGSPCEDAFAQALAEDTLDTMDIPKKEEGGEAFHEKKDKNKKVNMKVRRAAAMKIKYKKPKTRGQKKK